MNHHLLLLSFRVMREWAKNMTVDPKKIMMLADGEGLFHSKIGESQQMR